jgi:hypothetical protein
MDRTRDHVLAQPQNTRSFDCQLQQHSRAIGTDGTPDIDAGQLAMIRNGQLGEPGFSAQGQACVTDEIGSFNRPPVTGKVTELPIGGRFDVWLAISPS